MGHSSHGSHNPLHHLPVEPVAAIVLSAAGVLTSWAGYQAELWDGVQLVHYGRASSHRVEASQAALEVGVQRAVEVGLFRAWAEARSEGDQRMARFYEDRFPPTLKEAFDLWVADRPLDDPKGVESPFAHKGYTPDGLAAAKALERDADKEFQSAIQAKHHADAYVRAAVVLALAMFFAGIGQVFKHPLARAILAVTSIVGLLLGAAQMLTLPVLQLSALH